MKNLEDYSRYYAIFFRQKKYKKNNKQMKVNKSNKNAY